MLHAWCGPTRPLASPLARCAPARLPARWPAGRPASSRACLRLHTFGPTARRMPSTPTAQQQSWGTTTAARTPTTTAASAATRAPWTTASSRQAARRRARGAGGHSARPAPLLAAPLSRRVPAAGAAARAASMLLCGHSRPAHAAPLPLQPGVSFTPGNVGAYPTCTGTVPTFPAEPGTIMSYVSRCPPGRAAHLVQTRAGAGSRPALWGPVRVPALTPRPCIPPPSTAAVQLRGGRDERRGEPAAAGAAGLVGADGRHAPRCPPRRPSQPARAPLTVCCSSRSRCRSR